MRLSRYFLPVLKETPAEASIASHRYMLRAGMIKQNSAGIYTWLPMGHKVLKKIEPEMLRITDRSDREMLYGPTNEDMITDVFRSFVRSYKDLPQCLYHIQWKFRDERRPRFGIMRGREFLMKDAYCFDIDAKSGR